MSDFIHNRYMDKVIHKKLQSMGLFKPEEVQKKIGVSQSTLSRWVDKGFINHVSRGLYIHIECLNLSAHCILILFYSRRS